MDVSKDIVTKQFSGIEFDEVLEYLNYEEHPHTSIAAFPGMDRRTITFNGFSKAYCMAGW